MRQPWAEQAVLEARIDPRTGLPTLAAEYLVLMKLTVSRSLDVGDLSRILGARAEAELDRVRAACAATSRTTSTTWSSWSSSAAWSATGSRSAPYRNGL